MEKCIKVYGNPYFVWLLLGILALSACAKAESFTQPRRNVNLSPFQQWRSAAECLLNVSMSCSDEHRLNLTGTLIVNPNEVGTYCKEGCAQHTIDVLNCIHDVKRDFWFSNNANIWTLKNLINDGCLRSSSEITTANLKSSSTVKVSQKMVVSVMWSLISLAFVVVFML